MEKYREGRKFRTSTGRKYLSYYLLQGVKKVKKLLIRFTILLIVIAAVGGLFIGCNPGFSERIDTDTGILKIMLSPEEGIKSLEPDINMVCAFYDVTVTGGSTIVDPIIDHTTGPVTIPSLKAGVYDILVTGKNDVKTAIGEGTAQAVVLIGESTPVEVTVTEFSELPGTLDLLVDWSGGDTVALPVIESEMSFGAIPTEEMLWTLGTDQATYSNDDLTRGWYGISFRLYNDCVSSETLTSGFATLARIVSQNSTSGQIDLIPSTLGFIEILINLDFYSTLDVLANHETPINLYNDSDSLDSIDVSVDPVVPVIYSWYVNGVAVHNSDTHSLDPANYEINTLTRIDVLAIGLDGKDAGSRSWNVNRGEYEPGTLTVKGITPSIGKGYYHYFWLFDPADTGYTNPLYEEMFDDTGGTTSEVYSCEILDVEPGDYKFVYHYEQDGDGVMDDNSAWNMFIPGFITVPNPVGTIYHFNW